MKVNFSRFSLDNGLRVIVNEDHSTQMVALTVIYDVGSKDEQIERTGFAHLFEHLMFGGSVNIPDYDAPLEKAGGTNNAYTNADVTCFHCKLPKDNIETGFWLESDRMLSLSFSQESLDIQKHVVIEEFKQNYLNAPYGDLAHLLHGLIYKKHPYQWPTIGLTPEHIETATMDEVKRFFFNHYAPNNAVLTLSGNITTAEAERLSKKWFGPIPRREVKKRNLPQEPQLVTPRRLHVERDVPHNMLLIAFPIGGILDAEYPTYDLITDLLANGESARLKERLTRQNQLFTQIDASVSGNFDPGYLLIGGFLQEHVAFSTAENALMEEIRDLQSVSSEELDKVKTKFNANFIFQMIDTLNRAEHLGLFEILKEADLLNQEIPKRNAVSKEDIQSISKELLTESRSITLEYAAKR